MSIARMGADGSDIYLFHHMDGHIECSFCKLNPEEDRTKLDGAAEALAHCEEHCESGHHVPQYVLAYLHDLANGKCDIR